MRLFIRRLRAAHILSVRFSRLLDRLSAESGGGDPVQTSASRETKTTASQSDLKRRTQSRGAVEDSTAAHRLFLLADDPDVARSTDSAGIRSVDDVDTGHGSASVTSVLEDTDVYGSLEDIVVDELRSLYPEPFCLWVLLSASKLVRHRDARCSSAYGSSRVYRSLPCLLVRPLLLSGNGFISC